jgi:two-component system, cell cycle sensor histidine kinase and response regulator CckA
MSEAEKDAELQQRLQTRHALLESLESFPFPIWRSGCAVRHDYVNRTWLDFTGRALQQEVGDDGWTVGIHPDDLDAVLRSYQDAFHVRVPFETEYRLRRHDGEYRWVIDCGAPVEDAGGNFAGYIGGCYDITERKQTEGLWEEAEILANLGSWEWDILTGALTWSDELYRVLGLNKKAFCPTHQTFHELLHPDDRARFKGALDDCLKGRRSYDCELRIVRPDGTVRTVQSRGRAFFDETDRPLRMIGTAQDITERKRTEERIRELGAIVESSDDAILGKTLDGIITSWNKGAEKIYGYLENEVIGQPISILVPTDREDETPQILGRLARGEAINYYETVRRRKDGQEIQISLNISPIRNLAGRIIGASSIARDITERKRVDQELMESEERFRELAENIGEVFWISDLENKQVMYVSPAYEKIWGRSCESLYASPRSWIEAIHPEDKERSVAILASHQLQGSRDMTYRIVRPDGSIRWIRDRGFPVRDESGNIVRIAGISEDITESKEAEGALQRANAQLRQVQKMEAIGRLTAGVAHDFNNLLTVISGHSELLAMFFPSEERWSESISEIRRATKLGTASIRQLLAFGRQQILEPKVLDLNAVISETEKMLRRLIGEDVRLITVLHPGISPVRADLGQLNQMILNLAVNARDAMPQGGNLTLETRQVDLHADDIESHLNVRPGRYVLLTVADTGWGMAPDVQARIFEPFFTNKGEGQGTGLGLSVVLGIIQQSEGCIDVESRPGIGTKFKIYLPSVQEPADELPQSTQPKPARGSETVLLVEDEEPVRNITSRLLQALGYRVVEAENGEEALRLFNAYNGKIDLLLTDVVMPGLGGREVAEALRALNPDLKVLFQSGYTDDTVVRRGILRSEVAFLKKPFTLDVLARKVREVLDRPGLA